MADEEIKVGDGRWVKSLGELLNGVKTCIFGAHFDSDGHFPPVTPDAYEFGEILPKLVREHVLQCSKFKVVHPNKRSSEHTQIMHMYLKIRKEGNKCHELPQYHQVLIEL